MDNDFPKVIAKETSNPRSPYDVYKAPEWAKPKYPQQPEPKEDTPVKEAGNKGFLQQYVAGMDRYQQSGTDIPALNVQTDFARESGGPTFSQTVAQGIPVGQDPIFPMGQEEFSDYVRGRMEQRNPPNQPIPADILRRIQGVRAKYGFNTV